MQDVQRYDRRTIILHWTTAVLVVALWGSAQVIDWFPRGWPRVDARSVHITMGVTLVAVLIWRVAHRLGDGRKLPPADRPLLHAVAKTTHYGLYALLATQVTLGVLFVWLRGDNIWNLFSLPALPLGDKAFRENVGDLHGLIANVILILAGVHAAASLVHHYVWRDNVLRRMLPQRP